MQDKNIISAKKRSGLCALPSMLLQAIVLVIALPAAFIISLPGRIKSRRVKKDKLRTKTERKQNRIARSSHIYNDFTVSKAKSAPAAKKEHEAVFAVNGLSGFESWYNTTSILLHQKSERARQSYKREYEHIFEHPTGWCDNRRELFKKNFYDFKLDLLGLLPGIMLFWGKLTSPLRRLGRHFARSDSSSFALSHMLRSSLKILNWAAPCALALFAVLYISDTMRYDVQLMVYIGGDEAGIVESRESMETSVANFESTASSMLGADYHLDSEITYKLVSTKQKRYLSGAEIYNLLSELVKEKYTMSWALYVDGSFVAAADSYDELSTVVSGVETARGNEAGDTQSTAANRFQIVRKLCANDSIETADQIYWLLIGGDRSIDKAASADLALSFGSANGEAAPEFTYNNDEDVNTDKIAAFTLAAPDITYSEDASPVNLSLEYGVLRTDGAVQVLRTESLAALSANYVAADGTLMTENRSGSTADGILKTVNTEIVDEDIPFATVYEDTSSYYVGTEKVTAEGVSGVRRVTYNVEYVNGVEYSRIATDSEVVSLPTSKVILRGTALLPSTTPTGTFVWPASGSITSGYGARELWSSYDFHLGIDISGYTGKPVYAADGGTVIFAGSHPSYGYLTIISHGNGKVTYYAHQSQLLVSAGDKVYQGQYIGKMGSTGDSTGPHLHFEIRINDSTVNPLNYLP